MTTVTFDQSAVLVLLQDYLLENNLVATCRALELESGCTVGQNNEVRYTHSPLPFNAFRPGVSSDEHYVPGLVHS
jgi:hypothetical protein